MQHELLFNSSWAWWSFAAAGAAAAGLVLYLYRLEAGEVGRLAGAALTALRLLLVGLVLAMLAQPAWRTRQSFTQQRQLAVLLDDSLSMGIADGQASPAERLRWADAVGLLAHDARPIRPEVLAAELAVVARLADELAAEINELRLYRGRQTPAPATLLASLPQRAKALGDAAGRLHDLAAAFDKLAELRAQLPPAAQGQWVQVAARLDKEVLPAADGLSKSAAGAGLSNPAADEASLVKLNEQADGLARLCRSAAGAIDAPLAGVSADGSGGASLAWSIDAAVAARLDAEGRAALDRVGQLGREELARRLLARGGGLLDRLRKGAGAKPDEQFAVNVYRFARTSSRIDVSRGAEPNANSDGLAKPQAGSDGSSKSQGANSESSKPRGEDRTDPGAAIEQVFAQSDSGATSAASSGAAGVAIGAASNVPAAGSLAGILLLTDGQFNGATDPAAAARQRRLPVVPVRIGSAAPPADLAVLKLQTPDSLFKEDSATVSALVKMDGLAGRDVEVQLVELPTARDGAIKVVQSKRLRPAAPSQRVQVEFNLKPDRVGVANYRVEAKLADAGGGGQLAGPPSVDVMPGNDAQDFAVVVTEEPTKVLLVDGPPRWEFRYLTNLLLRDKGVLVQHLCFSPAFIQPQTKSGAGAGVAAPPPRAVRSASVKEARDKGVAEVDALPRTVEELFAFDVVILGDVLPADLPDATQRDLERFVSERGGTLILIAGKESMPARYVDHPLAGLMPVTVATLSDGAARLASLTPFHVRLTEAGARSEVLRLAVDAAESQRVWDRLPESTWRSGNVAAKAGAVVFAYAEPVVGGDLSSSGEAQAGSDGLAKPQAGRTGPGTISAGKTPPADQAGRERPLVLSHNYGLGQVMFLGYDRTWQLRYKAGDEYHHRLWAQVMRWATAGRLPAGTEHVKLGSDRVRYRPGERIGLRAKISRDDFTPCGDADASVEILRDGKVIGRANLLRAAGGAAAGAASQPDDPKRAAVAASGPDQSAGGATDGIYVAQVGPLPGGAYTIALKLADAPGLAAEQTRQPVSVECFVEGDDPAEVQELAARSPTELAADGLVLTPSTAGLADQLFGQPVVRQERQEDIALWSSWYFLALFAAVASAEWLMRKKAGLI